MIKWIIASLAVREGFQQLVEAGERKMIFKQAEDYSNFLQKPLLVVGPPRLSMYHGCGDVTIDITESESFCDVEIADVRDIPYPDRYFGASYVSHVLEHLPAIEDAFQALDELERVSDRVFVVSPHKTSLIASIHPGHHLWVTPSGDGYIIEQRGEAKTKPSSYVIAMEVR